MSDPQVVVDIEIEAPISSVYAAVSDPRNYGRWSPEATGAVLSGDLPLRVGDRFTGKSKLWVKWSGHCVVVKADKEEAFAFEVKVGGILISRWTYETASISDNSTRVTEKWDDLRAGFSGALIRPSGIFVGRGSDASVRNALTMAQTLDAMKADLEPRTGN